MSIYSYMVHILSSRTLMIAHWAKHDIYLAAIVGVPIVTRTPSVIFG